MRENMVKTIFEHLQSGKDESEKAIEALAAKE
jgi:hypothetical protein